MTVSNSFLPGSTKKNLPHFHHMFFCWEFLIEMSHGEISSVPDHQCWIAPTGGWSWEFFKLKTWIFKPPGVNFIGDHPTGWEFASPNWCERQGIYVYIYIYIQRTLPKTNSLPLQMMVSNRNLLFQGVIFRCKLLVSGRVYIHMYIYIYTYLPKLPEV